MGFLKKIFGAGTSTSSRSNMSGLNPNNICDVCFALGCLAGQVGAFDTSYVQVKINSDCTIIQAMLNKDYCVSSRVNDLNNPQDLMKLRVDRRIANFVTSLNGKFSKDPYYMLEVKVTNERYMPSLQEIINSIMRSQGTVRLMTNYNVLMSANGVVLIEVRD